MNRRGLSYQHLLDAVLNGGDQRGMVASESAGDRSLADARDAYRRRSWETAYNAYIDADRMRPLAGADLEQLAWAAALTGRNSEMIAALDRFFAACLAADDRNNAARAAFWTGMRYFSMGEPAKAGGWLMRCQRLVDEIGDCTERGLLLLPATQRHLAAGNFEAARASAAEAAEIGMRFGSADLVAFGRCLEGRAALRVDRVPDGLALLDEAMLAASAPGVMPLVTGLVYCSVIAGCNQVFALERCREWTEVLGRWCDAQPELGIFSGICLVHRAEVDEFSGDWRTAWEKTAGAAEKLAKSSDAEARAAAAYRRGEILRLSGAFAAAADAYAEARSHGMEPQPGLALLRLAEGDVTSAAAQLRRMLQTASDRMSRSRFLPAAVEVLLAGDDVEAAEGLARELEEIAAIYQVDALVAMADHAAGRVAMARREPMRAEPPLRRALSVWLALKAPFLAARVRLELSQVSLALGDTEAASFERGLAAAEFDRLGAVVPDVGATPSRQLLPHGLTAREVEVLGRVATGQTNKEIGRHLGLAEKTVDRHVSNILTKLDVPSRAGATAAAYRLGLAGTGVG
ncbi:Transcriptional regulatory protein LiaR [Gammaproteobacteria bacterium]|nr:Transcriptional regulatory protein LiaR [Gammaproteobacteria bacterium]